MRVGFSAGLTAQAWLLWADGAVGPVVDNLR